MKKICLFFALSMILSLNVISQTLEKTTYFDFGDTYQTTSSPDVNGKTWNNINTTTTPYTVALVDGGNSNNGNSFQLIDVFGKNGGSSAGGLVTPESLQMGDLAIASATGDYFYTGTSASFKITGLSSNKEYRFSIFSSRSDAATRITQYTITGANLTPAIGQIQTTGTGIGLVNGVSYNGNTSSLYVSPNMVPDANGEIKIKISLLSGATAMINAMKMEQYAPLATTIESTYKQAYNVTYSRETEQISVTGASKSIELFNLAGVKIQRQTTDLAQPISTSSLNRGIYLVSVDNTICFKVVKQ